MDLTPYSNLHKLWVRRFTNSTCGMVDVSRLRTQDENEAKMFPNPIILTNDDGIDAPGLQTLLKVLLDEGELQPVIIAPENSLSGCSHYATVDKAINVIKRDDHTYVVQGSPVDCVRLAIKELVPEAAFVISGINLGGNMGHDIYLSGTVAAAREAAFHRVPAISISQYVRPDLDIDWKSTAHLAIRAFHAIKKEKNLVDGFWNINLPHLEPRDPESQIAFCACCTRPLPVGYEQKKGGYEYQRGFYHKREHLAGTDVGVCFRGDIAISRIYL